MKQLLVLLFGLITTFSVNAQQDTILFDSFRNWTLSNGWQLIDNDTSSYSVGQITKSITAGTPPSTEIMDYMLGIKAYSGVCKQIMISPELQLGSDPWLQCYSYKFNVSSNTSSITMWILPNPNNTTLSGITDSITVLSGGGYNNISLSAYQNTSIRIAFVFKADNPTFSNQNIATYIDDLNIFNKQSLAYVPDNAFRSYLQSIVPGAFVGDSLNHTSSLTTSLTQMNASSLGIHSLEGLQYFPNLRIFRANYNQILGFPVNRMPYLDSIAVSYNQISVMPDVPVAKALYFDHNQVHTFPDFSNQQVVRLYANNNLIYGCMPCSNRFVYGSVKNNVQLYIPCFYYYLLKDASVYSTPCITSSSRIKGMVYYDINNNGSREVNEPKMVNQPIQFLQSNDGMTSSDGEYAFVTQAGPVEMNVTALPSYFTCVNPLSTATVADEVVLHDFRIVANTTANDLEVNLVRNTPYNATVGVGAVVSAKNLGTASYPSTIKIALPAGSQLWSSTYGTVVNDTLIWNVSLNPLQTVFNAISLNINPLVTNHVYPISVVGESAGDINTSNNSKTVYFQKTVASQPHDPNYKLASDPIVDTGFFDYETYTIRFENTGLGNATYVSVRDQLPANLDPTTFEYIGSTHTAEVSYGTDNLIQFTFNNITLTPKSVDSLHSYGFIWFRIKPKNPMQLTDTIKNRASIIFNTEAPITTAWSYVYVDPDREVANSIVDGSHFCKGQTISFTDMSNDNPIAWEWSTSADNQFFSDALADQLLLDSVGTFQITQIAHWETGQSDTITKSIYVSEPCISIQNIPAICHDETALILNFATPAGGTYSGSAISGGHLDASQLSPGLHSLHYSYTDQYGCSAGADKTFEIQDDYSITAQHTICSGETYTWEGMPYSASGIYTVNYLRASGCDSVLELNLEVLPELVHSDTTHLCDGAILSWNNQQISVAGSYQEVVQSSQGCDSTLNLQLYVHPTYHATDQLNVCMGSVVEWQGQNYSAPGTYTMSYQSQFGCDSVFYLELIQPDSYVTESFQTICENTTYNWNGTVLSNAGVYLDTLSSVYGCDSILKLTLIVNPINVDIVLTNNTTLNATAGMQSYQWIDCVTNSIIPGENESTFDFGSNGNYAVIVSNNQCTDTSSCYLIDFAGITGDTKINFNVYPNPFNNQLTVDFDGELDYEIVDMFGKIICSGTIKDSKIIHVPELASGLYMMKAWTQGAYYERLLQHIAH